MGRPLPNPLAEAVDVPRWPLRRLIPACLLFLSLASCAPPSSDRAESAPWQRHDLWLTAPRIEQINPSLAGRRVWRRHLAPRGTDEVRDVSRLNPWQRTAVPNQRAGEVQLGAEPFLTVVPLGTEPGSSRDAVFRVGLREASGRLRELFHRELGPVEDPAPPTLEIDLGAWSGAAVEILFQVDRPALAAPEDPSPFALWGSPQVWSRKEAAPSPPASLERPNVLLLGVDTLRADALGVYGRSPSTSPALDRLAEQSDVWLEAYSTFNNTNPSFASIHTGLYGKNHGIYDLVTPLPEEHTTLAELLGAVGYRTLAVIAARHLGHRTSGLGQGFDEVVSPAAGPFAAELVVDAATDWIATGPEPFFAWLHLYDPHTPHTPPQPFALGLGAGELTGLRSPRTWRSFRPLGARPYIEPLYAGHEDLYAGEVAYLDRQIDRLLDALESHGLLGRTIIAFVADHGENFGEHGLYASHVGLWETTTHVPLMIRWPGESSEGRRLGGLVQTLDLFPTLLRATGIDPPANDGRDLLELTTQGGTGRRVVMSQHANRRGISARTREWRYVSISGQIGVEEGEHLYDLTRDPRETENVAELHPERLQELADLTRRWRDDATPRTQAPQPTELSPEDIDRLKALGYLR